MPEGTNPADDPMIAKLLPGGSSLVGASKPNGEGVTAEA